MLTFESWHVFPLFPNSKLSKDIQNFKIFRIEEFTEEFFFANGSEMLEAKGLVPSIGGEELLCEVIVAGDEVGL
jgi:hypothetical protein